MATINTTNVQANEVVKAEDFNFAFEGLVDNMSLVTKSLLEANQDFVINGKVKATGNDLTLKIQPIMGVCFSTDTIFADSEESDSFAVTAGTSDRIDIVEVKASDWVEYDQQQRAFKDFETDIKTYQDTMTKKKKTVEIVVKQGTGLTAPDTDSGYVKLAEIHYSANSLILTDDDIFNITSDVAGLENSSWTNEKSKTYNIGYISDVNNRFRQEHNADGSHKDSVIKAKNISRGESSNDLNGTTIVTAKTITVNNEEQGSSTSVSDLLSVLAGKITEIFNYYLKNGAFNFNGELSLSDLVGDNNVLTNAFKLKADGVDKVTLSIAGNTVLTIQKNSSVYEIKTGDNYTVTTDGKDSNTNKLVTTSVTNAIWDSLTNLNTRVTILEGEADNTYYTNNVLSTERFSIDSTTIRYATTTNISLSGSQTIDGYSPTNNDYILVKNQTNATENGIYQYSSSSSWPRITDFGSPEKLKGKLFVITSGVSNGGKIFYMPKVNFTDITAFGTDQIPFSEYFGSIANLKNKIAVRDSELTLYANLKGNVTGNVVGNVAGNVTGQINGFTVQDSCSKSVSQLLDIIYPVGSLYWSSKSTNPSSLFGGTWKQIKDTFVWAKGDSDTVDATGGSKNKYLTVSNLPSHNHSFTGTAVSTGNESAHESIDIESQNESAHEHFSGTANHTHDYYIGSESESSGDEWENEEWPRGYNKTHWVYEKNSFSESVTLEGDCTGDHTHRVKGNCTGDHTHTVTAAGTISNTGDGAALDITPPYVVKYCWERTA